MCRVDAPCTLWMLEAVKGGLCLLEVMRCVLLYAGGCGRWALLLKALEALEVPEVMRSVMRVPPPTLAQWHSEGTVRLIIAGTPLTFASRVLGPTR